MWSQNRNTQKWEERKDKLNKDVYNSLRQDLEDLRFYSKCLDGTSYLPINNLENTYDILRYDNFDATEWYVDSVYSSDSGNFAIDSTTIDTFNKYVEEYSFSLKSLFTPQRTIKDSINNFLDVDVTTTEEIPFLTDPKPGLVIDGVRLKNGQRILVKDQQTTITLPNSTNPDVFFDGNYYITNVDTNTTTYFFYNNENGIYKFTNNALVRESDLEEYSDTIRYSIYTKLGNTNKENQYHLSRLKTGFYPIVDNGDPIEFLEKKKWLLRNKVEYQNILDIDIFDSLRHGIQTFDGFTIPTRSVYIGEFGSIFIHQDEHTNPDFSPNPGYLNIIENKLKKDLFGLEQTEKYYWAVGQEGTLIKIDKIDLSIETKDLDILNNLNSISFFNNLRGITVGDFNQIWYTLNGGDVWKQLNISEFENFKFNKVIFYGLNDAIIVGDNGVLVDLTFNGSTWDYDLKKPIRKESINEEFDLVRNLNDIIEIDTNTWGLTSSNPISTDKEFFLIVGDDNLLMTYNRNNFTQDHDYLFLKLQENITNIKAVENIGDDIYLVADNHYRFDLNIFTNVDTISNEVFTSTILTTLNTNNYNNLTQFNNIIELVGDNLTLDFYDSGVLTLNSRVNSIFTDKLKSKLLFLDYDMGSKLNFFGDDLEYRLPQEDELSLCIGTSGGGSQSTIEISSLSGEDSWLDYHRDNLKDFEYDTALNTSNEILYNTEFRYGTQSSATYSNLDFTNSFDDVEDLLNSSPTASTNATYQVFSYDNYTIFSTTNTDYQLGDVIELESDTVSGKFMVIKIITFGSDQYIYLRTNFDENITNTIIENSQTLTFKNINIYEDALDFVNNFNNHYVGISYKSTLGEPSSSFGNCNDILFEAKYDEKNAYYNLATQIEDTTLGNSIDLTYSNLFLNFQYTPTYNILDYLNNIDSSLFVSGKEFFTMPQYTGITVGNSGVVTNDNKLSFNPSLKFEWDSLWEKTFIDINIDGDITEKCFILRKYYDSNIDRYIVELHKEIDTPGSPVNINILSRRTLGEISNDLNEINNIQTNVKNSTAGNFTIYGRELNFKFNTDSYAKILLSDIDIKESLTGMMFTDYKNEISLNVIKLENQSILDATISSIPTIDGIKVKIITTDNHNLSVGDVVILDDVNDTYSGFLTVRDIISPTQFVTNSDYTTPSTGTIRIPKFDPYLSYLPSDIIDVGIDGKSKISVLIKPDNVIQNDDNTVSLVNLDLSKYKFNLIDGLYLDLVSERYPWILEAEITQATIGVDDNGPIFYNGIWHCGRWFGGTWYSGDWISGDWYEGEWNSNKVSITKVSAKVDKNSNDNNFSKWFSGNHHGGTWNNGSWYNGRWINGTWNNGEWFNGQWDQGTWNNGTFEAGTWIFGTWNNGKFNSSQGVSTWIDGTWNGGDFESGTWLDGNFTQKSEDVKSRFGTNPTNSRKAIWKSGKFFLGEFHSILRQDSDGNNLPSLNHKYSIFETGKWSNGTWWGGTSLNIVCNNGIWKDGVSKEVEITQAYNNFNNEGTLKLSGVYNFNRNDEIYIIDNLDPSGNWSSLGTNQSFGSYLVKDIDIERINNIDTNTIVTVYDEFDSIPTQPTATVEITSGNNGDPIDIYFTAISASNSISSTVFNVNSLQTANDIVEDINLNSSGFSAYNGGTNSVVTITKLQEGASYNGTLLVVDTTATFSSTNFTGGTGTYSTIESNLVSKFKGADWENGLWYNGIFEGDIFRSGMWVRGSFLDGEFL
jgi:hypothetical protein